MIKTIRKYSIGVISTALLVSMFSMTSFASEDREEIGSIKLDITADYDKGDEADEESFSVETSTDGVSVSSVELNLDTATKDDNKWSKYDAPELTIYLSADDDYYFNKCSKGSFSFEGADVEYLDAKRDSDKSEIELKIRVIPLSENVGNVSNLFWDDNSIAHWKKGYKNSKYDIKLYYNDSPIRSYETTNTSYDFANDMNRAGEYYFSVRGKAAKKYSSDFIKSDSITITDVQANELVKKVVNNTKTHNIVSNGGPNTTTPTKVVEGWQSTPNGWWYRHSDGGYTKNNWEFINNKWYYFNDTGYMVTGWQYINNKWYLLSNDGDMVTGWQFVNNKWYFMNPSGDMKTGWIESNGLWYYLSDASGEMLVNTITPDGKQVNGDGVCIS